MPSPLRGSGTPGQQGPPRAPVGSGVTTRAASALTKREEPLGALAVSDAASGDSAAAATMLAHKQLQEMQRELDQLRLEKQTRLRQEAHYQQQQQQPQQEQQQPQRTPPQVRMSAVQPGELAYHKASEGTTLADWLFKLEQLLSQLGVGSGEFGERVRIAAMH